MEDTRPTSPTGKPRGYQFSLRGLLLVVTVCAPWCLLARYVWPQDEPPEDVLERQVRLEFREASLADVVDRLSKDSRIEISVDLFSLVAEGVDPADALVSIEVQHAVPLRSALALIFEPWNLGYVVEEGKRIHVKHREFIGRRVETFDVSDLVRSEAELKQLVSHIQRKISPKSWQRAGGDGIICAKRPQGDQKFKFVTYQSVDVLCEIGDRISYLLRVRDLQSANAKRRVPLACQCSADRSLYLARPRTCPRPSSLDLAVPVALSARAG